MKRTSLYLCLISTALVLFASCAPAPEPEATVEEDTGPTIQGVWEIVEIETVGGPDEGITVPQATLVIITEQYYSSVRDTAAEPRPLWESDSPSEKEMLSAANGFNADSGTYEFDGSTLVIRPSVATMPNYMAGGSVSFDCQLEADSLTLIWRPDSSIIPGTELAPVESTETHYRMKRLE
jgi:hypothetical protein